MDDNERVSILTYPGPGCTPHEPMALVATISSSPMEEYAPRAINHHLPSNEGTMPVEIRYSKRYDICDDYLLNLL